MTFVEVLPKLNACLNGTSALLIFLGAQRAAAHQPERHRTLMLSAFGTSSLFLFFYLLRFYLTGTHRFEGADWLRYLYLFILFSHMLLAISVVPLVFRAMFLGLKNRIAEHRKVVRWAYPIWLYVSVTGVVVYVMLYHLSG